MVLKEFCIPRPSVFAADRRATVPYHTQANLSTPQLAQAPTPAEATSVSDEDGRSMRVGRWQGQLN